MYLKLYRMVGSPYLILGLVVVIVMYLLVIRPYYNAITVTLNIDTDHASTMEIFPPVPKLGYTVDNVKRLSFPVGESEHVFSVRYLKTRADFRLDPSFTTGVFVINHILIEHLGLQKTIKGSELVRYLDRCDQAICQSTDKGFSIEATGSDSKVFLKPALVPFMSRTGMIAALFLLYLGVIVLYRFLATLQSSSSIATLRITIAWAVLVYLVLNFLLVGKVPAFTAFLDAIALILVAVYGLSWLKHSKSVSPQSIESYIILISAAGVIMLGFSQSFTTAFLDNLGENLIASPVAKDSRKQFENIRSEVEAVYTKHFYGKDTYINLDAKAKIFGLGFTPNTKSILGQDGWYFEGYGSRRVEQGITRSYDNITDYMGLLPFSRAELEQWRIVLEERYYWLKERGIDYIFALAPTKALIYPEKLPRRILQLKNSLGRETRYDQLVAYLQQHSVVPVVDLKAALLKAREQQSWPLFYRTDFHWNYLGSFYAYDAILDVLNQRVPGYELESLQLDELRIEANFNWSHHAFLRMVGLDPLEHKDDTYLTLYPENQDRYDDDSVFYSQGIYDGTMPELEVIEFGENATRAAIREVGNSKGELGGIFVIGDSFSEKMIGYFSAHAKTVYNYRTVSRFLTEPIEQYKPEIVIQEILNMYILRKPPVNPPALKNARKKYLQKAE